MTTPDPPDIPDYTLLRPIGKGGYGQVWLARTLTGEHRALKIVQRQHFDEDRHYQREFRGIQAYSPHSRAHPALIPIHHVGRDPDDQYFYYVMDLADDLTGEHSPEDPGYTPHTLAATQSPGEPQPIEPTLALGQAIANALAHLHAANLIHRDLKPANILYLNGQPRLADPGLVTEIDAETSLVGTLGYLPPEGPGHPSADCFALGKILYELSTGQNPAAFPRLPEIARSEDWPREARRLNQVITTACAIDPVARYETATHLAEDLARVPTHQPLAATRARRQKTALAATLALTATTLWLALGNTQSPPLPNSLTPPFSAAIPKPPPRMSPMQFPPPTRILHVRPGATGDGRDWANALGNLHTALAQAKPGTEIRLSTGIYRPVKTMTMLSGVRLRGGFSEDGSEQDWQTMESIVRDNFSLEDRQIHLIQILPGDGPTLIEGIRFASGNGSPVTDGKITAGIAVKGSKLTLKACRFSSLNAHSAASLDDGGNSVIRMERCEFVGNRSHRGGTVHIGVGSRFEIDRCLFFDNTTNNSIEGYRWGGALFVGTDAEGSIYQTVFGKNFAWEAGGAIFNQGHTAIIRCTFFANRAPTGSAIHNYDVGTMKIWNSLFSKNTGGPKELTSGEKLERWHTRSMATDDIFINPENILGPDGIFYSADDGLRLKQPTGDQNLGAYSPNRN